MLSRQRDESVIIGDDIVITIVDIRGDKVRLGISAPTEITVHRQEVYEAIQRNGTRGSEPPTVQPVFPKSQNRPNLNEVETETSEQKIKRLFKEKQTQKKLKGGLGS